ncbi:syndecan-2-like [Colossoma macropomum]|uniref:syndecan-2-like n=1 Tax=Colossoma macropomum TaxID=42526 RepID=UPI001864469C|nr:syndecan-2-like [Colossoma macropomum]
MRNVWMLLTLWALCFWGEGVLVSGQALVDDLYLEEQQSGDFPDDDDDFSSGSGSGFGDIDDEDLSVVTMRHMEPIEHFTQTSSPSLETSSPIEVESAMDTTVEDQMEIEVSDYQTEEPQVSIVATSTSSSPGPQESDKQHEVRTENLFQRTEVLAAVIAGGVIGFLFAIFLILLLVYRMRKKDEGSYDLGERKPPSTAYQKAPTKEFYA